MKFSTLLRHGFRRCGLLLCKMDHPAVRYFSLPPDNGFRYALHQAFSDLHQLRFVQVGANDGQREDPLAPLIREFSWSGIMVEPRPVFIAALKKRYAQNSSISLVQAAIAEKSEDRTLYYIRQDLPGLPDWAHGLATLAPDRITTACQDLGRPVTAIAEETVSCLTWDDLDPLAQLDTLSVLVMDTEGYDIPLLKLWNWDKRRPRVIHFENGCASPKDHFHILDKAREHGYEIVTEGVDTTLYLSAKRV